MEIRAERGPGDLWVYDLERSTLSRLTNTAYDERLPTSGRDEVYVGPFPDGGRRYPVTRDGGINPAWARSGAELFYIERDSLMSVFVAERAGELELGEPAALLDASRFVRTRWELRWSVMPGDREFMFIEQEDPQVRVWIATNRLGALGSSGAR